MIRIVHGDARAELPRLDLDPERTVVITDPPWPGPDVDIVGGGDEALPLFREVAALVPRIATRFVVQLGQLTDPRGLLESVPADLPFATVAWLRYMPPGYRGCFMQSADVAYVFGTVRIPPGRKVLSSECRTSGTRLERWDGDHPCPRNIAHLRWLLYWYAAKADTIVDPFCGSGTTLAAAAELGLDAIGIDCDERWCAEAQGRVEAARSQQLLRGVL